MTRVRVNGFSVSLDGFGAGPRQDKKNPLGVGEPFLAGLDLPALGFQQVEYVGTPNAAHCVLARRK